MTLSNERGTPLLWEELLPGGAHWSGVLRRGVTLRLTTGGPDANVAALFYSREQPLERYSMADTLKAQRTAMLTVGHAAYTDMGRVLFGITQDSCGWHDPLCGLTDAALVKSRYGATRFQEQRNQRLVSGREALIIELGKQGLGERDLVANINFFSRVTADAAGRLAYVPGHSKAHDRVSLRFEMDTIVLLHAGPHPLDTRERHASPAIVLQATRSLPILPDDACVTRCAENARGYRNTQMHCQA